MPCPLISNSISSHPLIAIVGPTATGKSKLALELARRFDGEIVNGDSRQVYRKLDIGTAKPSPQERDQVPHHLVDIVDPDEPYSLALYLDQARHAIQDIHDRGRLPFLANPVRSPHINLGRQKRFGFGTRFAKEKSPI